MLSKEDICLFVVKTQNHNFVLILYTNTCKLPKRFMSVPTYCTSVKYSVLRRPLFLLVIFNCKYSY